MSRNPTPTLINLPPPPAADSMTPDMPGTPTSTTTSLSELSTVAIKDGHRGHLLHNHHNPMDAERADRISRLAGFDRMAQPQRGLAPGGSTVAGGSLGAGMYSAAQAQAQMMARERSTVGSASATTGGSGAGGGRTTWASGGSDTYDPDRMSVSEDMDVDTSSVGGFSDEGAPSLVGFGEGARTPARQIGSVGSPSVAGSVAAGKTPQQQLAAGLRQAQAHSAAGASPTVEAQRQDARLIDGMTYDKDIVDTANRTPPPADE